MSTIEKIDDKSVRLLFNIDSDVFNKAIINVYNKNKNKISIHGFRKGKAPLSVIENYYGKDYFYNDALNHVLPEEFDKALNTQDIETVGDPEFKLENISDDRVVSMSAVLLLRPVAQVENYKNISYRPFDINVTDEEINKAIESEREKNSRLIGVDRQIEDGDTVNLNCQGYVDGKAFEAGKAENYDLVIGSHTFIDTFEPQLIGKKTGDNVEVNVTFPEDYHHEELAGKPARFEVHINKVSVKELPELNDDFAQDVSEFDTLDEYKKSIRSQLESEKKQQAEDSKEDQITEALIKNTVVEIPSVMTETVAQNMLSSFAHSLSSRGLSLDSYLNYMGQTRQSLLDMYKPSAEKQVKVRLALEAIAKSENLTVSQEEIDEEINRIVEQTKLDKEKILSLMNDKEKANIEQDIVVQKAMKLVLDSAVPNTDSYVNNDAQVSEDTEVKNDMGDDQEKNDDKSETKNEDGDNNSDGN